MSIPVPPSHVIVRRFDSLEGLRGYMAWWVVAGHAIQISGTENMFPHAIGKLLLQGSAAVNVFIILSGFVITHLILDKREPYRIFVLRRGLRILPVYFLCLILAMAARPAFEFAYTAGDWVTSKGWAAGSLHASYEQFLPHLMMHLGLLHGLLPDSLLPYSASTFLGPAWSVSLEWQFYLLAPLIVSLLRISPRATASVMIMFLCLVFAFKSGRFGIWQFPSMLLLSMHFFLVGILCRLLLRSIDKLPPWTPPLVAVVGGLLLPSMKIELLVWGCFLAATMVEAIDTRDRGTLARLLLQVTSNRPVRTLGKASYSTYLVHMPLWSIVIWAGNELFGFFGQGATIALILLSLAVLIPISLLLYRFVERPFIAMGARFGGQPGTEALPQPIAPSVDLPQAVLQTEKA